jgi:hypothetical protein
VRSRRRQDLTGSRRGIHRHPTVNGYSGFWPDGYFERAGLFMRAPERPPEAISMLHEDGVTHVLVHESRFLDDRGRALSAWLRDLGSEVLFEGGGDVLFRVPSN